TTETWRPSSLRSRAVRPSSLPRNRMVPSLTGWRPTMTRAVVDLPQPDSPTMPSVSPRDTVRETSLTAWTRSGRNSLPVRALWTTCTPSSSIVGVASGIPGLLLEHGGQLGRPRVVVVRLADPDELRSRVQADRGVRRARREPVAPDELPRAGH